MTKIKRFIPNSIKDFGQLATCTGSAWLAWYFLYGGNFLIANNTDKLDIMGILMMRLLIFSIPIGGFMALAVLGFCNYVSRKKDPAAYERDTRHNSYGF